MRLHDYTQCTHEYYIYIYICTYIDTYIKNGITMYQYTFILSCINIHRDKHTTYLCTKHIYTYVYICTHMYLDLYICVCVDQHKSMCIYAYMNIYTNHQRTCTKESCCTIILNMYMRTYIYVFMHIYIYINI